MSINSLLLKRSLQFCRHHVCKHQAWAGIGPVRWLNLQEYQSKKLMVDGDINVQQFRVAESPQQAKEIADSFNMREYVIKAQILAGGRGKGVFSSGFKGGVHLTKDANQIEPIVAAMLGNKLKTKQTTGDGVMVSKVMVAEALDIARETYFAILMDRDHNGPVMVGSPEGGMDIEEVAATKPEAIFTDPIDIIKGISNEQAMKMAGNLNFTGDKQKEAALQIRKLYELFIRVDATQVEINPFGETPDGQVVCFDAKINFDDNAEHRQKEIFAMGDNSESDPREAQAASHNLNYIGMEGNIGCLVNGAGLAMATMDIVQLHGGQPANFLDCGGGVTEDQVYHAFNIIASDSQVKAILVNVFGGIVNCETIANGVVNACRAIDLKLPVVCRLEGTNVESARNILEQSGLAIEGATSFQDVAEKAVNSLKS